MTLGCDKNYFQFEFNLQKLEDHWSTSDSKLFLEDMIELPGTVYMHDDYKWGILKKRTSAKYQLWKEINVSEINIQNTEKYDDIYFCIIFFF